LPQSFPSCSFSAQSSYLNCKYLVQFFFHI
jgi:hypothetical protein